MFKNLKEIAMELEKRGYDVSYENTYKNGKEVCCVKTHTGEISPILYETEELLGSTIEQIEALINAHTNIDLGYDVFERMKNALWLTEHIEYKVVPSNYYEEEIISRKLVNRNFGNFTELYYIRLSNESSIQITEELMNHYEWCPEGIAEMAHVNTYSKMTIRSFPKVLSEMSKLPELFDDLPEDLVYIISNTSGQYGGCYITDWGAMQYVSKKLGWDTFYIVPSSIHELLIYKDIPTENNMMIEIIKEVNNTTVQEGERLSYSLFKWEDGRVREVDPE